MNDLELSTLNFQRHSPESFPLIKKFYKSARYFPNVGREDIVFSLKHDTTIVSAVRLIKLQDDLLMRSMVVAPDCRGNGVGIHFLALVVQQFEGRPCWCYPLSELESFYAKANFEFITPKEAPEYIRAPYGRYVEQGKNLIIMRFS